MILFAVMTNNLLRDWHLRIKFVDNTTALEILPRNGISLLNVAVNNIHKFSIEHNMKLNPKKCKEMLINFMQNDNFTIRPIVLGNNTVECVTASKLLGIIISNYLKWNEHIDYISMKASKRLYSLRILKKVGVNREGILKVYLTTIRPILEYGVLVWQDIREFLSKELESIQKRALHIIYPCHSYLNALNTTNLSSLKERRTQLCCKYIQKMTQKDHHINFLKPRTAPRGHSYHLRASDNNRNIVHADRSCCRTQRSGSFISSFVSKYVNM